MEIFVWLVIIGVGLYLVNTVITMDEKIKTIINVLAVVLVVLWLLNAFTGHGVHSIQMPRFR